MSSHAAVDLDATLPADLHDFGSVAAFRLTGPEDGPLVAVLGGISGDRFVAAGRDGGMGWWPGLVGPGRAVDPSRHRVLGLDFAADGTGRRAPSTHDQARVLAAALEQVGRSRFDAIVGASYGGMVALAFADLFAERVDRLVIISAPAAPHPAATAARELQRRVVALGLERGAGADALAIARGMAMLTYRTSDEFAARFRGGIGSCDPLGASHPGSYLRARGQAFVDAMPPERFLSLSASIDRHLVDPARIRLPAMLIGAEEDQLVPPNQIRALARGMCRAELHLRASVYGHDMFLKEAEAVGALVGRFLDD